MNNTPSPRVGIITHVQLLCVRPSLSLSFSTLLSILLQGVTNTSLISFLHPIHSLTPFLSLIHYFPCSELYAIAPQVSTLNRVVRDRNPVTKDFFKFKSFELRAKTSEKWKGLWLVKSPNIIIKYLKAIEIPNNRRNIRKQEWCDQCNVNIISIFQK